MKRNKEFLPATKFPEYNKAVDRYMMASKVFNGGADKIPSVHTVFFDKRNMEAYMLELSGDPESGKYIKRGGEVVLALIPSHKARLNEIAKQFEKYKVNRVNQGFEEPSEMPKELLSELYDTSAKLTVYEGEYEELSKHLSEYADEEHENDDDKVLQWGLRQHGKLRNNQLESIDSQRCSQTEDGIIIIDDARSPYNGMAVSDYRKLARQWQLDREDADRKKLLRVQAEAKEKGERIPQALPVKSMHRVNINSLPKWPEFAKTHLINSDSDSFITK
jgi:hypothetical protein